MDDVTLRSIFSAGDETSAQLDRLLSSSAQQRSQNLGRLEHLVSGLGHSDVDSSEAPPERRERPEDRRPKPSDPEPFVALPQRTTHGGPWGPKMREKLTAIALGKRGW